MGFFNNTNKITSIEDKLIFFEKLSQNMSNEIQKGIEKLNISARCQ